MLRTGLCPPDSCAEALAPVMYMMVVVRGGGAFGGEQGQMTMGTSWWGGCPYEKGLTPPLHVLTLQSGSQEAALTRNRRTPLSWMPLSVPAQILGPGQVHSSAFSALFPAHLLPTPQHPQAPYS